MSRYTRIVIFQKFNIGVASMDSSSGGIKAIRDTSLRVWMYKHKQCLVSNKVFKEFSLLNLYRIFMDGWGPARLVWALWRRITSRWRVKRATSAWYTSLSRLPCGPNVCPSSCSDRGNLYNVNCIVAVNLFRDKIFSCCKIFSCDFRFYYEIIKLIFWLWLFSENVKLVL